MIKNDNENNLYIMKKKIFYQADQGLTNFIKNHKVLSVSINSWSGEIICIFEINKTKHFE